MDDALTQSVLQYQNGLRTLEAVRNQILVEAFSHLSRYGRKGEDDVSEFLLQFHAKIEGLMTRFRPQGLPFRHYLLRTLRWQWNTFRADSALQRRRAVVTVDAGIAAPEPEAVAEPSALPWLPSVPEGLPRSSRRRLVLLALKAAPFLEDCHWEALSAHTGAELAWLQACQRRLRAATDQRRSRRERLREKHSEAYYRRLMAEDAARREVDPERRALFERRAQLYRSRLINLHKQTEAVSTAPTHSELARLLGMPKGSVDSSLYHLKKALGQVYIGGHDDPLGHEQRPQKDRA